MPPASRPRSIWAALVLVVALTLGTVYLCPTVAADDLQAQSADTNDGAASVTPVPPQIAVVESGTRSTDPAGHERFAFSFVVIGQTTPSRAPVRGLTQVSPLATSLRL